MSYHIDKEVNSALVRLLDALCEHERGSGRRSTLVLIPHSEDERLVVAEDGKPFPESDTTGYVATRVLTLALENRNPLERLFK